MKHHLTVATEILSEPNQRGHYRRRASRSKKQRLATFIALQNHFIEQEKPPFPLRVVITRVMCKGQRDFDDDNLAAGCKAIRDEIAKFFGVDDRKRHIIRYEYAQEREPVLVPYCRITITPIETEKERPERMPRPQVQPPSDKELF